MFNTAFKPSTRGRPRIGKWRVWTLEFRFISVTELRTESVTCENQQLATEAYTVLV